MSLRADFKNYSYCFLNSGFLICLLFISVSFFGQKRITKKFETLASEIEISTLGLDDFVIETAETAFVEIYLFAENANAQHLIFEEEDKIAKIQFILDEIKVQETVFRKFITKRLQRARAIVKIPKDKKVTIFGENINIRAKSYQGDLAIYIEKGSVKLDTVKAAINLKLYAGNVFATLRNTNIDVVSNLGAIKIDNILTTKFYRSEEAKFTQKFKVNSVKANIFLTRLKTQ